jgi:Leucine-rich repeat (LRR) protein
VALTSLSAQHNKISELPKEIGELRQLRNLKLHDNQIEHLPPTFGQLVRAPPTLPR